MVRLCGRPGCSEPGTVAYGMVPEDLLFWIAALDSVEPDAAVLCRRHADAIVVPRGWTLDDRREPTLRLFRPPAASDDTGAIARRRRRDHTPPSGIPLQLDLAGEGTTDTTADTVTGTAAGTSNDGPNDGPIDTPVTEPIDAVDAVDAGAGPGDRTGDAAGERGDGAVAGTWRPEFDVDDDLDGLLQVDSPLLARAFRGAGRPRS